MVRSSSFEGLRLAVALGKCVCFEKPDLNRSALSLLTTPKGNPASIESYKDNRLWIVIANINPGQHGAKEPMLLIAPIAKGGNGVDGFSPVALAREWTNFIRLDYLQQFHWYMACAVPSSRLVFARQASRDIDMSNDTALWKNQVVPALESWTPEAIATAVAKWPEIWDQFKNPK